MPGQTTRSEAELHFSLCSLGLGRAFTPYSRLAQTSPFPSRLVEVGQAESSSTSFIRTFYGLVSHFLLLPTSPLDDAVAVSYKPENECLGRICTSLTVRAHRRTRRPLPEADPNALDSSRALESPSYIVLLCASVVF